MRCGKLEESSRCVGLNGVNPNTKRGSYGLPKGQTQRQYIFSRQNVTGEGEALPVPTMQARMPNNDPNKNATGKTALRQYHPTFSIIFCYDLDTRPLCNVHIISPSEIFSWNGRNKKITIVIRFQFECWHYC